MLPTFFSQVTRVVVTNIQSVTAKSYLQLVMAKKVHPKKWSSNVNVTTSAGGVN